MDPKGGSEFCPGGSPEILDPWLDRHSLCSDPDFESPQIGSGSSGRSPGIDRGRGPARFEQMLSSLVRRWVGSVQGLCILLTCVA